MARSFTVEQLVDRAKQRTELENDSLITDAEWQTLLSTAYGELYSEIAKSGLRYFESEDTISTDGNSAYALPADFLWSIGVDYEVSSTTGERRALPELMVQERNFHSGTTSAPRAYSYALVGSNVKLYPTPPSGQTYYHIYVPQPTDLSGVATSTSVDVVTPDGEAFLTWAMTVMAQKKDGADPSEIAESISERNAAKMRLRDDVYSRSLVSMRRRIVDTTSDDDYLEGDYWPPGGGW